MSQPDEIEDSPAEAFVAALRYWRDVRTYTQSALARAVGYGPSYVSKVESGQQRPSRTFADSADRVLNTGGSLVQALDALDRPHRSNAHAARRDTGPVPAVETSAPSLVVEQHEAELVYDGTTYRPRQRRLLYNASDVPVTRYLIRISVDRHPGDPDRSNLLYREDPLTWDELGLVAVHDGRNPMNWTVRYDRDAFKELWLRFENEHGRFPLYPGERAWIEYSYTVSDRKWGNWFQRAVRLPTRHLGVRLVFPAHLRPVVWGTETTMTAESFPFRTAIDRHDQDDQAVFDWSTHEPPLHGRYRLEWRFEAPPASQTEARSPSETMRELGIVQEGDPILRETARPFDLPAEAEDARRVIAALSSAMSRVEAVHVFGKGMGIAAPQIGIGRAAALVRTPAGETITLINPVVIEETPGDEQYEGCLSFFDVRGIVNRPLTIHVEHQDLDGNRRITIFDRGTARLVAHEIDHLNGILYTDRMAPDRQPIPVSKYRQGGQNWSYPGMA
jgi:peptide deformylase